MKLVAGYDGDAQTFSLKVNGVDFAELPVVSENSDRQFSEQTCVRIDAQLLLNHHQILKGPQLWSYDRLQEKINACLSDKVTSIDFAAKWGEISILPSLMTPSVMNSALRLIVSKTEAGHLKYLKFSGFPKAEARL